MKRFACAIQRTGQPRCAQLTENATNSSSFSRRSQAAVLAVTPAQGRGEASRKVTFTVSPTLNSPFLPTLRHVVADLRKSGATMNPRSGTPRIAADAAPSATLKRARRRRRALSSGGTASGQGWSVGSCFMSDVTNPACEGDGEEEHPHARDVRRGDDPPEQKGHRERDGPRPEGRPGQRLGVQR